jgi:hypothetical protein
LGDFKKQLLELQFPVDSLVLSGFTVVSAVADARGALTGVGPSKVGLPIVTLPQGEAFRGGGRVPRFDIQTNVAMSCADGQAEVRLGGAQTFNQRIVHGRVHFLLSNDFLVGLRVLDINEVERETLLDYMMHHPNRGGPS